MKKYLAILIILSTLGSCRSMLTSNIDADLAAVNITLQDKYEVKKVSKGIKNTISTRSYTLLLSDKDASQIINDITESDSFDSTYHGTLDKSVKQNIAYRTDSGYTVYVPDKGGAYRTAYIDTIRNELHISYNGMLF